MTGAHSLPATNLAAEESDFEHDNAIIRRLFSVENLAKVQRERNRSVTRTFALPLTEVSRPGARIPCAL